MNGLGAELAAWKDRSLLKLGEHTWYLSHIERACAALDSARDVLASAVRRVEDERRYGR